MPAPTNLLFNTVAVTGTGPHFELTDALTSGSLIGQLGAIDPDAGDTVTFELLDDAGGLFFLSGNLLRRSESGVLDPNLGSYTVTVRVTDSTGATYTTDIVLGSTAVTNTVVADGTSGNDVLDYTGGGSEYIIADAGDDDITGDNNDIVVYSGRREDYDITYTPSTGDGYGGYGSEEPGYLTITDLRPGGTDGTDVVVNIGNVIFADGRYFIDVTEGVESFERIQLDGRSLSINGIVAENQAAGQVLGQITLEGFDPSAPFTILSVGVNSFPNTVSFTPPVNTGTTYFNVNAAGQLVTNAPLDFESFNVHSVFIEVMDPNGNIFTQALYIEVLDGPEAPVGINLEPSDAPGDFAIIGEHSNRLGDVEVGRIAVTDPDGSVNGYAFEVAPEFADDYYLVGDLLFLREGSLIDAQTASTVTVDIIVRDLDLAPGFTTTLSADFYASFERLIAEAGETALVGTSAADIIVRSAGIATVHAGDGNDVIVGNLPSSSIRWVDLAAVNSDISGVRTQSFGAITATIEATILDADVDLRYISVSNGNIYYTATDPFVDNSYYHTGGGAGPTSLLTISFADGATAQEVTGMTFRLLDVDASGWQDIVAIRAFDAAGAAVAVTLTGNGQDSISGNIVTGANVADNFNSATGSILVTIAGAAHHVEIDYSNGLPGGQALGVSDVHFNLPGGPAPTGAALFGEGGNDFVNATNSADTVSGGDGNDQLNGLNGNDTLTGDAGNDQLNGGAGVDTLNGGDGDDILDGGIGADIMIGGLGNDTYFVNLATDTVTETSNQGTDTVNSAIAWTLAQHFENLTLTGGAGVNATGNTAANVITGNLGPNVLAGLGGNDTLIGGAGNDRLTGGAGADSLTGGAGADTYQLTDALDTITELVGEGTDLVQAYQDHTLGANLENLNLFGGALVGIGNELANRIIGTSGANTLSGLAGNDYIYGGASADVIIGGAGRDFLYGEAGADQFVFDDGDIIGATSATADLIRDFSLVDGDTIDLSAMDAVIGGADDAFTFIGDTAFTGTAGELRYQTNATVTIVMGDTDGDGTADFWIVLTGVHPLDGADFGL